jgi:hypothetical protein
VKAADGTCSAEPATLQLEVYENQSCSNISADATAERREAYGNFTLPDSSSDGVLVFFPLVSFALFVTVAVVMLVLIFLRRHRNTHYRSTVEEEENLQQDHQQLQAQQPVVAATGVQKGAESARACARTLREYLQARSSPVALQELLADLTAEGFSETTIYAALGALEALGELHYQDDTEVHLQKVSLSLQDKRGLA